MTIEQLKDLLSTYGVNDDERNGEVSVTINGATFPITGAEIEHGLWDEESHQWIGDRPYVRLQTDAWDYDAVALLFDAAWAEREAAG